LTQRRDHQWFKLAQAGCHGGTRDGHAQRRAIETDSANVEPACDLSQRSLQRHQAPRIVLKPPKCVVFAQPLQRRWQRVLRTGWAKLERDRSSDCG
jgi:hypothetical protein